MRLFGAWRCLWLQLAGHSTSTAWSFQISRRCLFRRQRSHAVPESFVNQGEEYFRDGKLNLAIEAYQNAVYSDPGNPSNYIELARLQVFAGLYDEAITNSQNALLKNPNNPTAHAVLGWALGFKEDYGAGEAVDPRRRSAWTPITPWRMPTMPRS